MHTHSSVALAAIAVALSSAVTLSCAGSTTAAEPPGKTWSLSSANPMLARGESHFGLDSRLIWNDPSVLKEGAQYTMWVSAGLSALGAQLYRLSSANGTTWSMTNAGNPVLEPSGDPADFDCIGVETPAVLKVGSTYHMYYSAYQPTDGTCTAPSIFVTMGHATSTDGLAWTKVGELTSLTANVGDPTGNTWGWLARAEPSVIYYQDTFHLYFADVRCRMSDCSGTPVAERGISLATSADGQVFAQVGAAPILLQSAHYPAAQGFEGYSTPWALVRDGGIDLFVDVARTIDGNFYQVALAHFTSADGMAFATAANDVVVAGSAAWSDASVRSPTVVEEVGNLRMWYAGDNYDYVIPSESVVAGIGLAAYE